MQVYPNNFQQQIQNSFPAFLLVFGEEPQQKLDVIDFTRAYAKSQGFTEKLTMVADSQFEWDSLLEATQSMSLFCDRQYIELELPTGKPGTEGAKVLNLIASHPNSDVLLLIHGPKIGKDVQNSKWFKAIDQNAYYVPCFPLEGNRLTAWLQQQIQLCGLVPSNELVRCLIDYFEGNLLAAKQEIQKIALLYPEGQFDLREVEQSFTEQSKFNVFQMMDVLLEGNAAKTMKLLSRLEDEGIEPTIIMWALNREWQILQGLSFARVNRTNPEEVFKKHRIWRNKQTLYNNALNRLNEKSLATIRDALANCDSAIKNSSLHKPYVFIAHICLLFMPVPLDQLPLENVV